MMNDFVRHEFLVEEERSEPFFAPVNHDLITGLVSAYRKDRRDLEALAERMADSSTQALLPYFFDGNCTSDRYRVSNIETLFNAQGAIGALNSSYWSRALELTDVIDCMPQKRRDEWFEHIRENKTPDFEEETVRATLIALLGDRAKFLAERVDGIFRSLSREHLTNRPEGFGRRMILYYMTDSLGGLNHSRAGVLNDLRAVIAKLQGRGELNWNHTYTILRQLCKQTGQWFELDGGALRIRLYKKGTAHLEVHPDIAWRLNQILAHLYPAAIPSEFREPPKRRAKQVDLLVRPLPFAVLDIINEVAISRRPGAEHYACQLPAKSLQKPSAAAEALTVLKALGGVGQTASGHCIVFDYNPHEVIRDIVMRGVIPEHKSHQFYPTPELLVERVHEAAQFEDHHTCLEPSAGLGALVSGLDPSRVTCVEVSEVHTNVLKEKGFANTHRADFLAYSQTCALRFDRVVMNPPFSKGRWQAHLEAAAGLVGADGRLVAILPSGAQSQVRLPGFSCRFSSRIDNAFQGTGVSVVILTADRTD